MLQRKTGRSWLFRDSLEHNLARFTHFLQEGFLAEETARLNGWFQKIDARVKLFCILILVLTTAFSRDLVVILCLYLLSLIFCSGSRLLTTSFVRRIWMFMPLYTAFVAAPALFLTPGDPLWGSTRFSITAQGLNSFLFLVMRVATTVSFMMLLVLTTSWPRLLKAMRSLGCPRMVVFLLAMTYRYVDVLLQTANSLFLARKSRRLGHEEWRTTRSWIGALMGSLLGKSLHLSQEVFLAMQSRGFRGEPLLLSEFNMRKKDWLWFIALLVFALVAFYAGFWRYS